MKRVCSTCVHAKTGKLELEQGKKPLAGVALFQEVPICFWNPDDLRVMWDDHGCGSGWKGRVE